MTFQVPDTLKPAAVRRLARQLEKWLIQTPTVECKGFRLPDFGTGTVYAKFELLQRTGTFKPRGALSVMMGLSAEVLARGVTAVSAGNHAIATAFAAQALGSSAKIVLFGRPNPVRVERCRRYGAELVVADDVHAAFALAERVQEQEGRYFVHPFEGIATAAGTATVGLEMLEQAPNLDTIVVPIGGGGLCAGIATIAKQLNPDCEVIGVEPVGADSMRRSFAAGTPASLSEITTIADSLGAPFALPISYQLCRNHVDRLVMVSDLEMRQAMARLFTEFSLAVEPACAASTAAVLGPLRGQLRDRRVGVVLCGSNIDWASFAELADFGASNDS